MRIILETNAMDLLEKGYVTHEEAKRVQPGKEDSGNDLAHSFFPEAQIVATYNGRIHEEHPNRTLRRRGKYEQCIYLVASAPYWLMIRFGSG